MSAVRAALAEMVGLMITGEEPGAGSPWYERAVAALESEPPVAAAVQGDALSASDEARRDAELYGVGFVVNGSRVDPAKVVVFRNADTSQAADIHRLTHERDALGQAIADAALKAGMYNGEVALTGPHLIMFAQHLGDAAMVAQQEPKS